MTTALNEHSTVIAFTCRADQAHSYSESRNALSFDWMEWCSAKDVTPLILPNHQSLVLQLLSYFPPDLIILTGGNDSVEGATSSNFCKARNVSETTVIQWALERRCPLLGVCRGMHMINLHFGGKVLPSLGGRAIDHVATIHEIALANKFKDLSPDNPIVSTNSFHGQGFYEDDVAPNMGICATCIADGSIEAIAHTHLPVVGIGWHPERANAPEALDRAIINMLINSDWKD